MNRIFSAFSAISSVYETAPAVSTMLSVAVSALKDGVESPTEDLLPKGLSFFKHSAAGVTYHGISCEHGQAHMQGAPQDGAEAGQPPGSDLTIVHCAHGFGASSLSFANLLRAAKGRSAANTSGSTAWVAHDVLGFGFTSAEFDLSACEDHPPHVQEKLYLEANSEATVDICNTILRSHRAVDGAVFLGHSMGCISAICSAYRWLQAGRQVGGVVLVAPAMSVDTVDSENVNNFLPAATPLLQSVTAVTKFWHLLPRQVRRAALAAALKAGVSLDLFWYVGLRFALGWSQEVEPETLEQYKSPMTRANWAPWLVAFIEANLIPSLEFSPAVSAKGGQAPRVTIRSMLAALLDAGVKVLVIHDPSDTFIPLRNSEQLVASFGGRVALEVVHQCSGHIPHETAPDCVLDAMAKHGLPV